MPDVRRNALLGHGSRSDGTCHKALAQLKDVIIQSDYFLSLFFGKVYPALFEVKQEQSCDMIVNFSCREFVTVRYNRLQSVVQVPISIQSETICG